MKLELKHLAPYLPYELKVRHIDLEENTEEIDTIEALSFSCVSFISEADYYFENSDIIIHPILRPLSDLKKEIEHNGENFTPFHRLNCHTKFTKSDLETIKDFWRCRNYIVFEKLFEWHFDVFGLIEAGLAIDVNTI